MMPTTRVERASHMASFQEDAFLKAFDEHADALFRHACFRTSSREKALDLTQEAYLKVWDYLRQGKEVTHWKSFLYRVLDNLIIDEYRRIREESLDAYADGQTARVESLLATGSRSEKEEKLDDELQIELIRKHIPMLSEHHRAAITLRYIDGFTPKEIAKLLDLSENAVSVRIHRAVKELRELCVPATQP